MSRFRKSTRGKTAYPSIEVTDETFEAEVLRRSNDTPVLVYVSAPWSAHCHVIAPVLENALSSRPPGQVHAVRLNADKSRGAMSALEGTSVPSMFAVSHGSLVGKFDGEFEFERVVSFVDALVAIHARTGIAGHEDSDGQTDSDEDLITAAAYLLIKAEDPVTAIAMVIAQLLRSGRVEADALTKIGVTPDEVNSIVEATVKGSTLSEFSYELEVSAAVREYKREADLIGLELGLIPGTDKMDLLLQELSTFAADNDLTDLRIAYRLLRAEHPERLPGSGTG